VQLPGFGRTVILRIEPAFFPAAGLRSRKVLYDRIAEQITVIFFPTGFVPHKGGVVNPNYDCKTMDSA